MLTQEEKKRQKAQYDREYREKNREKIRLRKIAYNESPAGRAMQKRHRDKSKVYHVEYCRKPEQRQREKHRRHIRENKLGEKHCIGCDKTKKILDFECYNVFPDKRLYLCRDCESEHRELLGCSTRNVMTAIVMRSYTNLTRYDIAKHPYLIEANKYLILLKQLVK